MSRDWWRPGMSTSAGRPGERVKDVRFTEDILVVDLLDGRTISVPLVWYPRLLSATPEQRANWRVGGGDSVSTGRAGSPRLRGDWSNSRRLILAVPRRTFLRKRPPGLQR